MKTSTTLLIAAGAVVAVVGIASAVSADDGRCERGFGAHFQQMRGPGHEMGHASGRPMGPVTGNPMFGPMFGQGTMGPVVMKRFFELADTDEDGKLTEAEIDAARTQRFETHDANGDGKLTLEEFDSLLRELTQPVTVRAFQFLDPDGDAMVTKEEFDRPTSHFVEFLDRNDDGALSMEDRHGFPHRGGFHHGRYDTEDEDN